MADDAFDGFIAEQFALWRQGKEVVDPVPSTEGIDAATKQAFMDSLQPISGSLRMGPEATFTFGATTSNEPKKSPYSLFSADAKGNVVLHRRYMFLVAMHRHLIRDLGWPDTRVRFYDQPYALVAYDRKRKPFVIGEARDTQNEAEALIDGLRKASSGNAEKRVDRLLSGLIADGPRLFWVSGPNISEIFELQVDQDRLEFSRLTEMPSWETLGDP